MNDEQLLERIAVDPEVMLGKPVIRGTRLTVEYVMDRLAHDSTFDDLMSEYAGVTREDLLACLLFAGRTLSETDYFPLLAEAS